MQYHYMSVFVRKGEGRKTHRHGVRIIAPSEESKEETFLGEAIGSAPGTARQESKRREGGHKGAAHGEIGLGENEDGAEDLRNDLEEVLWKFLRRKCFASIPPMDKSISGDKKVGPYVISQYLGAGAFGSVRLARNKRAPVSYEGGKGE